MNSHASTGLYIFMQLVPCARVFSFFFYSPSSGGKEKAAKAINLRADRTCHTWFKIQTISGSPQSRARALLGDKCAFRSSVSIMATEPPFFESSLLKTKKKRTYAYSRYPLFLHETLVLTLVLAISQVWSQISFCRKQQRFSSSLFNTFFAHRSTAYRHYKFFVFLPGTRSDPWRMGPAKAIAFLVPFELLGPISTMDLSISWWNWDVLCLRTLEVFFNTLLSQIFYSNCYLKM